MFNCRYNMCVLKLEIYGTVQDISAMICRINMNKRLVNLAQCRVSLFPWFRARRYHGEHYTSK